jgi:hypothetical protein
MEILNFKLPSGEIIKIQRIRNNRGNFVARCPPFFILFNIGNIQIGNLFFEFSRREQIAIIYHELWHKNNNFKYTYKTLIKKPWLIFYIKPLLDDLEFNADLYALKMTNKKSIVGVLIKLKKMIEKGIIYSSHEKTHPSIDERIKRIKRLKG